MIKPKSCQTCVLVFVLFASISNCYCIKSKIYEDLDSRYFCFRRLNGTHQIGCNSKEGGNVGVVKMIKSDNDFDVVLNSGTHYPYIPVMSMQYFIPENMERLRQYPKRVSGIILIDESDDAPENGYSPDSSCPNHIFSLYANDSNYGQCDKQSWNKLGLGLIFFDFPFPIFFIDNQTSIDEIRNCSEKYGDSWPLCAMQLIAPMNGAKDSVTCMRRSELEMRSIFVINPQRFCDPLIGTNIFSPLFNMSDTIAINNNSIIVLASRLDSISLFDQISPGADSALTSLITLLAIADTLNSVKAEMVTSKNVLFALFDGEAFDYIGSSRAVYDMMNGEFPADSSSKKRLKLAKIKLNHLSHFIELNQLAIHGDSGAKLYIHKNVNQTESITSLEKLIQENAITNLTILPINISAPLPPSSLQTFYKYANNFAGIVIANHEKEYTNKYYNSLYDTYKNVNNNLASHLTNIATVISRTVYQLLSNKNASHISSNVTVIESLIDCYLNNSACNLLKYVLPNEVHKFPAVAEPFPSYISVSPPNKVMDSNKVNSRKLTYLLLSLVTGDKLTNFTKENCTEKNKDDRAYSYHWMGSDEQLCVRSQALNTIALSPAFLSNDINMERYSSWTESKWPVRGCTVRIFLKPSAVQEWVTLCIGLLILCLSFVVVYFIDKKSSILFASNDSAGQQR